MLEGGQRRGECLLLPVRASTRQSFQSLLRIAKASIAVPPWFATPVDAMEDAASYTVVFHAPVAVRRELDLTAGDRTLTLFGPRIRGRRSMRLCAFSTPIRPDSIEAARSGELLRIRVTKKQADADSDFPSSST